MKKFLTQERLIKINAIYEEQLATSILSLQGWLSPCISFGLVKVASRPLPLIKSLLSQKLNQKNALDSAFLRAKEQKPAEKFANFIQQ